MCLVNTKAGRAMESINFNLLFELFLILFGIYLIISANKMKRTKEPATLLVQEELKNCRDKKGFATEMEGKLRFLGAVIAAYGVIGSVNDVYLNNGWIRMGGVFIFLLVCFWFVVKLRKSREKFL